MRVLAVVHGEHAAASAFGEVVVEAGHHLEEWWIARGDALPRPLDRYGAVLVFGGSMHADQEARHPWLRVENDFLQRVLAVGTPVLGVCLGAQLLAKATGAAVYPAREPEIGWVAVELTEAALGDPLFAHSPRRFDAFEWHYYTYDVPSAARELARSSASTQAFRLGEAAWGIQFHAEVTKSQIEAWLLGDGREPPVPPDALLEETEARIEEWERFGRDLCGAFVEVAERREHGVVGAVT